MNKTLKSHIWWFLDFDESGEVVAVKKPGPAVAEKPKTNPLAGDRLLLRFNLNVGSNNRNGERTSGLLDVITPDGNVSDDDNDRRDPRRRLSYPDGRTPTDDEDLSPEEIAATPGINIQGKTKQMKSNRQNGIMDFVYLHSQIFQRQ